MPKIIASLILLFSYQIVQAAWWDKPSLREPFIDGMEAMVDSMREHKPSNDPANRYRRGLDWLSPEPDTPFPSDDPWLDEIPYGKAEDSPFFRIPDSVRLRGRWIGQFGDGFWFKSGWVRIYRNDDHKDGRYRIKGNTIYIGFERTRRVIKFQYAIEDDLLALQDEYGRTYLYQRFEEDDKEASTNKKLESDSKQQQRKKPFQRTDR